MKSRIFLISSILVIGLSVNSCEWIFGPGQTNTIEKDLILDYNFGDIFIYTTEDAKSDTFEVTLFKHFYDEIENVDNIHANLNYRYKSNKAFIIYVFPHYVVFKYNYNDDFVIYVDRVQIINMEINGSNYNDVYIYENDLQGDSDTLITKLYYQGNIGILGYTYENGDEYLLDAIIKIDD